MPKTDGGPAYPMVEKRLSGYGAECDHQHYGLSKLERFAMAAMQGDWANPDEGSWPNETTDDYLKRRARTYYRMARAMIEVGEEESNDG
jgi:hypothetical protein